MRGILFIILCMVTGYAVPALAVESAVSTAPAEEEAADSIGPSLERRDALGYDPTRHSLLPDTYYRYRTWRKELLQKLRLEMLISYDMLGQEYIDRDRSLGGSSGDLTFSGRWLAFGQKYNRPVYLSFRVRHRHAYGDLAPSDLNISTGLLWKTTDGFTDAGFQFPDLYVSQELFDGKLILRYGQLAIDNFFDNHQLRSAKRYFLSKIFSANPAVAFPGYGTGFTVKWMDTRNWDVALGGSNIQDTTQEKEINLSLTSSALFYTVQGGYNFAGIGSLNARVQLLGWQSNDNNEDELTNGRGISLTLEQAGVKQGEHFVARYSFSDGDAALLDELFMLGWGLEIRKFDHLGFGFGLGRSADDGSLWQGVFEGYYRWQATKELMITPDLQIIAGEGEGSSNTLQIVAGIRAGITF